MKVTLTYIEFNEFETNKVHKGNKSKLISEEITNIG